MEIVVLKTRCQATASRWWHILTLIAEQGPPVCLLAFFSDNLHTPAYSLLAPVCQCILKVQENFSSLWLSFLAPPETQDILVSGRNTLFLWWTNIITLRGAWVSACVMCHLWQSGQRVTTQRRGEYRAQGAERLLSAEVRPWAPWPLPTYPEEKLLPYRNQGRPS